MGCIVSTCEREEVSRLGYCLMHYKRCKRNGTPDLQPPRTRMDDETRRLHALAACKTYYKKRKSDPAFKAANIVKATAWMRENREKRKAICQRFRDKHRKPPRVFMTPEEQSAARKASSLRHTAKRQALRALLPPRPPKMTREERLARNRARRLDPAIREAEKLALAKWREDNKAKVVEYQARYRKENVEHTRALQSAYRLRHLEQLREADRQRKIANADRLREERLKRYAANPEKYRAICAKWIRNNRGQVRARNARRYANKMRAVPPWFSPADQKLIQELHKEAARLTVEHGVPYHVDHWIPLQGEIVSGLHVPANLRVMQGAGNIKKGNRFDAETHEELFQ